MLFRGPSIRWVSRFVLSRIPRPVIDAAKHIWSRYLPSQHVEPLHFRF